jgi:TBC1 domain family member 14
MSYIVAMLLLNMDAFAAFKTLANMIEKHPHMIAFLKMDMNQINFYLTEFDKALQKRLPKLHQHFFRLGVSVDPVIIDWLMTIFSKSVPLDVAARIWDQFIRDGLPYLFKASIGLLKCHQEQLLASDFDECMTMLTRQLKTIDIDTGYCMDEIEAIADVPNPLGTSLEKMFNSTVKMMSFSI